MSFILTSFFRHDKNQNNKEETSEKIREQVAKAREESQEKPQKPIAPPITEPPKLTLWESLWTYAGYYPTWYNSGRVTTWYSRSDDATNPECRSNMALVRDDGYIFPGEINTHKINCDQCENFAKVVDGHLKGVEAFGVFKYE